MTDTTDKALDALVARYRQVASTMRRMKAVTIEAHEMDAGADAITALRAQLADLQSEALQYQTERLRIAIERAEAAEDRAEDAEAQLAKARPDALREAAEVMQRMGLDGRMKFARDAILALIDTPTPSAPSPLSLKSLEGVPQEERDRRRDAEFARRGWTQPSPEAVARAAMEVPEIKALIKDAKDAVEAWDWWQKDTYDRCQSVPSDAIDDLRATLAAIVAKAGGGE
jgi:hypothetical protein